MNRIESLRALLSDFQQQYYRYLVRYNTAKTSGFLSIEYVEEFSPIIKGILYYGSWTDSFSRDLLNQMRCK